MVKALVAGSLLVAAMAGCGGSTSTSLGGFQSSVPEETELDKLSTAQSQTLCSELQSFQNHSGLGVAEKKGLCVALGEISAAFLPDPLTNAGVQAACTSTYNQCVGETPTFECQLAGDTTGCTATVGEYEACLNDTTKQVLDALSSLPTCADLTAAQVMMTGTSTPEAPAPSCDTFNAKCPQFAVGDSTSTSGQ